MLKNCWTRMAAALASVACVGIVGFAAWPAPPGITRANFARIELGTTQAQVEALLGGPPRDVAPHGRSWMCLRLL